MIMIMDSEFQPSIKNRRFSLRIYKLTPWRFWFRKERCNKYRHYYKHHTEQVKMKFKDVHKYLLTIEDISVDAAKSIPSLLSEIQSQGQSADESQLNAENTNLTVVDLCCQILSSGASPSENLQNLAEGVGEFWKNVRQLDKQNTLTVRLVLGTVLNLTLKGISPESRIGQLQPFAMIEILRSSPFLLKFPQCFQMLLGLICLQTIENLSGGVYRAIKSFGIFSEWISDLQNWFMEKKDEFEMMRSLMRTGSFVMTWGTCGFGPLKCQEYLLGGKEKTDKLNVCCLISKEDEKRFLDTVEKYGMLDPKFHSILLDNITDLLKETQSQKSVISHFEVVLKLLQRNIFPDYDQLVFKAFMTIVSESNQEQSNILATMISMWVKISDKGFIIRNKSYLLSLGINQAMKFFLFHLYYSHAIVEKGGYDKKITNILVLWNLEMNAIRGKQFIQNLGDKCIEDLTANSQIAVHRKNSQFSILLVRRLAEKKAQQFIHSQDKKYELVARENLEKNQQVYLCYAQMLYQILLEQRFAEKPYSVDKVLTLNLSVEKTKIVREAVLVLLEKSEENKIFEPRYLTIVFTLCSVLQTQRHIKLSRKNVYAMYSLFVKNLKSEDREKMANFLIHVLEICKNKLSLFIILACLLKNIQDSWKAQSAERCLFKILKLLQNRFLKVMAFTLESLQLSNLLLAWGNKQIKQLCVQIICAFAPLCSKPELETILYQYDKSIYEKPEKYLEVNLPSLPPSDLLEQNLQTLDHLNYEESQCVEYFCPENNFLTLLPIREESLKNNLEIHTHFYMNLNLNMQCSFQIYSSARAFNGVAFKHRLCIRDMQISLIDRTEKKIIDSKQLNFPNINETGFNLSLTIIGHKLKVTINEAKLISADFMNLVDNIRLQMNGNVLVKTFSWKRFHNYQVVDPSCTYSILPAVMETKLTKTSTISQKPLSERLSMRYMCSMLVQIGKNMGKELNFELFYQKCFNVVLERAKRGCKYEKNIIKWTFNKLIKLLQSRKFVVPTLPKITDQPFFHSQNFHQLFLSSIVNINFFSHISPDEQLQVIDYLNCLLFERPENEYRLRMENKKLDLFVTVCKLMLKSCEKVQMGLWEVVERMILTHETTSMLHQKMKFIFYISESNNSGFIRSNFERLLNKILCLLKNEGSEENYHQKIIAKYIIADSSNLEILFLMVNLQSKIKILDFLMADPNLQSKGYKLFDESSDEEILQLSDWIFCYSKRCVFQYIDFKKRDSPSLLSLLHSLTILLKLEAVTHSEEERGEIMITIVKVANHIAKMSQQQNDSESDKLRSFLCTPEFVSYLVSLLEKAQCQDVKNESLINIAQKFFTAIFKMPKPILLKSLVTFRQIAVSRSIKVALSIFQLEIIFSLPIYALSIFLQFCLEILMYAKQSLTSHEIQETATEICNFIECLIKNYPFISSIKNPLLYVYPKLENSIEAKQHSKIKEAVNDLLEIEFIEFKGGIYFKLICLTWNLIEIFQERDLSFLIQYLLQTACERKVNKGIYRAVNDFVQVSKDTKDRTSIDLMIKEMAKQHSNYYYEEDEPYNEKVQAQKQLRISRKHSRTQLDLTPYFVDFFLMKLCQILENSSQFNKELRQRYSNLTIKFLISFEHIFDEMNEKNAQSQILINKLEQLTSMIVQKDETTVTEMMLSPKTYRKYSALEEEFQNNMGNFLSQSKFHSPKKRQRASSFDFTSGKKRKKDLICKLEENSEAWLKEGKEKQFHRYFRDETKEIELLYLFHELFVEISLYQVEEKLGMTKRKKLIQFLQNEEKFDYELHRSLEQDDERINRLLKKQQIRKVYPFTINEKPVIKLKSCYLPNLTSPILKYDRLGNHSAPLKEMQIQASQQVNDFMVEEKLQEQQSQFPFIRLNTCDFKSNESIDEENYCELSYRKGVFFCQWQIQGSIVTFISKQNKDVRGEQNERLVKYGAPDSNLIRKEGKVFTLNLNDVKQIFFRKFNQVKNNALEFFLHKGSSLYCVLYTERRTDKFLKLCKANFPQYSQIRIVKNFVKQFQDQSYTEKWMSGELSNFDYLMMINKYAGRSCCDLNQYYIFPWVLQDYKSAEIELSNLKIYRDLKKPMGALNPEKLEKYLEKLEVHCSELGPKYLYGSHYSTSLFLYYYMVRLEPFSTLHKEMQGNEFDSPDRLFSSMQQMWDGLMSESSPTDIKEAIPEFYYLPTFLQNVNELDLGTKQSGEKVNNVEIPPWADSHVNFIQKMRICLESYYVSTHLNFWIDLIFGKDQNSFEKNNVFLPITYVENVDLGSVETKRLNGIVGQITFFGQNPNVLFTKEHPRKKSRAAGLNFIYQIPEDKEIKKVPFEHEILEMKFYVSECGKKNPQEGWIKISEIQKSIYFQTISLNFEHSIHSLIRKIRTRDSALKRAMSLNPPPQAASYGELQTISEVKDSEITISMKYKESKEIIKRIRIKYKFSKTVHNSTVIVVFGGNGLRIYDWNNSLVWEYSSEIGGVESCYLEESLLFFSTSLGRVHVLDFFTNQKSLIFKFAKQTHKLDMLVFPEPKLPTKSNELFYKVMIIGDMRRIVLLAYAHRIGRLSETVCM